MGIYVSSVSTVRRHGAFAIEATLPSGIQPVGTGVARAVIQVPWGPPQKLYKPTSVKDLLDTIAPPGMSRTGSGFMSVRGKAFPTIGVVRVMASTAVAAVATLANAVPTDLMTVTAKYPGTEGNSLVATVRAASDGDANHFDLDVVVTGASGTTKDTIKNINISGTGTDALPSASDYAKLKLVGSVAKLATGRPTNANYTFSTGTTPALASSDYIGAAGTGDKGLALLEKDKSTRHVFVDDTGNSMRAAVNAGVLAHVGLMGDRLGYINGNSGLSLASTQSDAASYRSDRIFYIDPWVYQLDEVDGTKRLVPSASFAASVRSQLSPSTSMAWKNSEVQAMLAGINELEADRGEGAADNTDAGVVTIIQEEGGGFTFEAGYSTIAPVDPSKKRDTRRAMADYIAVGFVRSNRGIIDAPNIAANQQQIIDGLDRFMDGLKRNQKPERDPNHTPHIINYKIEDLQAENNQADLDDGLLFIPLTVKTPAGIEKLGLRVKAGEGVTIV
jgi:hypothetical protein